MISVCDRIKQERIDRVDECVPGIPTLEDEGCQGDAGSEAEDDLSRLQCEEDRQGDREQ